MPRSLPLSAGLPRAEDAQRGAQARAHLGARAVATPRHPAPPQFNGTALLFELVNCEIIVLVIRNLCIYSVMYECLTCKFQIPNSQATPAIVGLLALLGDSAAAVEARGAALGGLLQLAAAQRAVQRPAPWRTGRASLHG